MEVKNKEVTKVIEKEKVDMNSIISFMKDQGYTVTEDKGTDVWPKIVYSEGQSLLTLRMENGEAWGEEITDENGKVTIDVEKFTDVETALKGVNTRHHELNEEIELENIERAKKKLAPLRPFEILTELQVIDERKDNR